MLATDGFLSQRDANKPEEEKTKKKIHKKANKSMLIRGTYYILYK